MTSHPLLVLLRLPQAFHFITAPGILSLMQCVIGDASKAM